MDACCSDRWFSSNPDLGSYQVMLMLVGSVLGQPAGQLATARPVDAGTAWINLQIGGRYYGQLPTISLYLYPPSSPVPLLPID